MALDVANIVPGNGICEAKPYFATSIDLLSLAQNDKDVNEEQLAVPDSQYFSKDIQRRPQTGRKKPTMT